MKKLYYLLFGVFIFSCSSEMENESNPQNLNSEISNENLFLDKIREGTNSTEGITIKLLSYSKKSEIADTDDKLSLISEITNEKKFNFFSYDMNDKNYSDLELVNISEIKNSNVHNKQKLVSTFESALKKTNSFLKEKIDIGFTTYEISWEINGNFTKSLAIFNGEEFIYDNFISNLTTYDVKEIYPDKSYTKVSDSKSSSDIRTIIIGGRSISAYFMGGVDRGTADVTTRATYEVTCQPGGTGASYCQANLLGLDTDASCDMTWGSCDVQYRVDGPTSGTSTNGQVKYGMFLATTGISVSLTYNGSQFLIGGTADFESMKFAVGEYSYYTAAFPLD